MQQTTEIRERHDEHKQVCEWLWLPSLLWMTCADQTRQFVSLRRTGYTPAVDDELLGDLGSGLGRRVNARLRKQEKKRM